MVTNIIKFTYFIIGIINNLFKINFFINLNIKKIIFLLLLL